MKDLLVPALTVVGNVIPLTEYPLPFQPAEETVTSAFVAWRVPVKFELLPRFTLPKARVEGVTESCAGEVPPPPVALPLNGTLAGLVAPTTAMESVPDALPATVG